MGQIGQGGIPDSEVREMVVASLVVVLLVMMLLAQLQLFFIKDLRRQSVEIERMRKS
jgi:hypothetical protein